MILPVVEAAAAQLFGAVLPVIVAVGRTVIPMFPAFVFPFPAFAFMAFPFFFPAVSIVLLVAVFVTVLVVPFFLMVPVIPVLPVPAGLFAFHTPLFTDHAFLIPAHLFLLVAIVGPVHLFSTLQLIILRRFPDVLITLGDKTVFRLGKGCRDGQVGFLREGGHGRGRVGGAPDEACQQRPSTEARQVFHVVLLGVVQMGSCGKRWPKQALSGWKRNALSIRFLGLLARS